MFLSSTLVRAQSSTYVSSVDSELTISSWTLYPLVDNLDGIYARPLQAHLQNLMEGDRQFRLLQPTAGFKNAPEEFEEKSALARDFMKKSKVDAFIAGRIAKGPQGISIRLALISGAQGLPLGIETRSEIKSFDTEELKRELAITYAQLKKKMPYQGVIMSRRGTTVTLNVGRGSVREGQEVDAIQITKIQRHPRFGFIVSAEKEIMGKIRITKVDEALAFGSITSERTDGLLKPGFKIALDQFVQYAEPARTKDGQILNGLNDRSDAEVAFGNDPKEWAPLSPPTFGKVALMVGLGKYSLSNNLSAGGSVSAEDGLTPSFHVEGEMWLSTNWFLGLELHQYVARMDNGLSGSSPSKLQIQTLETELVGGYNVLMSEEFWGPKLQLMFGINQMDSKIEDSTPTAFTSMKYGGMAFGVAGVIPVGQEGHSPYTLGGKFMYYWNPKLSESPGTSGSGSSNNISTFSISGEYQWTARTAFRGEFSLHQYNTTFSGTGDRSSGSATSASHAITTLAGGIVFLF